MRVSHISSSPSKRIQRKRLEKQELVVTTAMELLASGGLESVTITQLAAELDYTPGALYRYFPSMEALFSQMQQRAVHSLGQRMEVAIRQAPPASLARVRAVASCFLDTDLRNAREVGLIAQMLATPKILIGEQTAKASAPALGVLLIRVDGLLAQAQDEGELAPGSSRERAVELWAALQGALALAKLSRFDDHLFSARRIGLALTDALITAWRTPATDTDPQA